jgi:hypothetical protein
MPGTSLSPYTGTYPDAIDQENPADPYADTYRQDEDPPVRGVRLDQDHRTRIYVTTWSTWGDGPTYLVQRPYERSFVADAHALLNGWRPRRREGLSVVRPPGRAATVATYQPDTGLTVVTGPLGSTRARGAAHRYLTT